MNRVAVYIFRDQQCMDLQLTMSFRYFKSIEEANEYAAHFKFSQVVVF